MIAGFTFVVGLALAASAAVVDARTHRLPNRLVGPLALVGTVGLSIAAAIERQEVFVGWMLGALVFGGPWLVINLISPGAVGFGDVKFSAAIGVYIAWFDPMLGVVAIALTAMLAWPHSVVQLCRRGGAALPLGPYLLAGAIASVLVSSG